MRDTTNAPQESKLHSSCPVLLHRFNQKGGVEKWQSDMNTLNYALGQD